MIPAKNGRLSWQEALKLINKCPICTAVYNPERAKLFAQNEKANLVHISCESCSGNFIAMILMMPGGISTIGMVSDLNFEDAKRLHIMPDIGLDELIDGRKFVNNNDLILKIARYV